MTLPPESRLQDPETCDLKSLSLFAAAPDCSVRGGDAPIATIATVASVRRTSRAAPWAAFGMLSVARCGPPHPVVRRDPHRPAPRARPRNNWRVPSPPKTAGFPCQPTG